MGFQAMELFVSLQGTGNVGDEVSNEAGKTLRRSETTRMSTVRSVFGTHQFPEFTYSAGMNCKIELASISARMSLPSNRWSYLLQEFSQIFCVDQAFGVASRNLEHIFGGKFSRDTLEGVNQKMGAAAGSFLAKDPTPDRAKEGPILVATADCKGVPLVTIHLKGDQGAELNRICIYLEKNKSRMRYDEYLKAGYPIATGVIEGACRHLVKDRMERSGMRWTLEGARQMLNLRAAFQSDYWDDFLAHRIEHQNQICHPLRKN
ncbi:MAG: hypothetical protein R3C03_23660 [Pirellulaceae bacterium]